MLDREVRMEVPLPFRRISEYSSQQGIGAGAGQTGGGAKGKDTSQMKVDVPTYQDIFYIVEGVLFS